MKRHQQITTVTATASNGDSASGQSGSGTRIGGLLRTAGRNRRDAKIFLDTLVRLNAAHPEGRSHFSCAEPHAVAILLNKGHALSDITIHTAQQRGLGRTIMECTQCSRWIYCGQFSEPDSLAAPSSYSGHQPELANLADFIVSRPVRGRRGRRGGRGGRGSAAGQSPTPAPTPDPAP